MESRLDFNSILKEVLSHGTSAENLREKKNSLVLRTSCKKHRIIVKFYEYANCRNTIRRVRDSETWEQGCFRLLSGIRGIMRNLKGQNPALREYAGLQLLYNKGLRVPKPLAICTVGKHSPKYTHVLFIEDLGGVLVSEKMRELADKGDPGRTLDVENQIIALTRDMLAYGIADNDHGTHNLVYTENGDVYKIDLEWSQSVSKKTAAGGYAMTLGSLIARYALETGCDQSSTADFAMRLLEKIPLAREILPGITACMREKAEMWLTMQDVDVRSYIPELKLSK